MKKECGTCNYFRKDRKCRITNTERKATDPACVFYLYDPEFMKAIQMVFNKN